MNYIILGVILVVGMIASVWWRKLTPAAAITGGLIGFFLYLGAGWTGVALMAAFFICGTLATSWKKNMKDALGAAESHKGRTASQVLANGGMAGLLALLSWYYPQHSHVLQVMIAACFSSAAADTLSSELGTVYGKNFYHILSFKKDKRGLDGVVSMEGFLFGLAGSMIIALVYAIGNGFNNAFFWIVVAGTIGNIADSILGAALERRGLLKNDAVNFGNTLIAAMVVMMIY